MARYRSSGYASEELLRPRGIAKHCVDIVPGRRRQSAAPPNRGASGICAGMHVAPAIVSGIVSLRGEVIRTREHEGVWLHCPTGGDYVGEPGQQLDHHGDGTRTHRVFGHRPAESELSRVYWNLWARRPRLARCKSVVARGEQRLAATGDSIVRYSGPTGLAQEFRP